MLWIRQRIHFAKCKSIKQWPTQYDMLRDGVHKTSKNYNYCLLWAYKLNLLPIDFVYKL